MLRLQRRGSSSILDRSIAEKCKHEWTSEAQPSEGSGDWMQQHQKFNFWNQGHIQLMIQIENNLALFIGRNKIFPMYRRETEHFSKI